MKYFYFLLVFVFCSEISIAGQVDGIKFSSFDNHTKIVIDLSSYQKSKVFALKNPDRIVVDIENNKWKVKNDFVKLYPKSHINSIRHALHDGGKLRIVFDMKFAPKNIKTSSNKVKNKIIIDADFDHFIKANFKKTLPPSPPPVQNLKEEISPFSVIEEKSIPVIPTIEEEPKIEPVAPVKELPKVPVIIPIIETKTDNSISNIFAPEEKFKVADKSRAAVDKILKLREKKEPSNVKIKSLKSKIFLRKPYVVVIDPGHGGNDTGAIGKNFHTKEKDLTLDYAIALKKVLEVNKKYKILLTRDTDSYLSLTARRNFARIHKADIFISLHVDSNPDTSMQGVSVYTLSDNAYDAASQELSLRENKAEMVGGLDLSNENQDVAHLLIDLLRRDTKNVSLHFAKLTTKEIAKEVKTIKDSHRFADFKVLKGVDIPAILIELGYISNKDEEVLLKEIKYRNKIITALARAVNMHFVPEILKKKIGETS